MQSYALENKPLVAVSHTGKTILESLQKSTEGWSLLRTIPITFFETMVVT